MKFIVRAEHLFYAGFSVVLLRQPLRYLFGPSFLLVLALGVVFCMGALLVNAKRLNLVRGDRVLAGLLLVIFVFHSLLAMVDHGRESPRLLWFSALAQLLTVILFLHHRRSINAWKFLRIIFSVMLIIECTLAFLQVSYYSTGIGLPPIFDEYENLSFVSGSFFNANDFSVFVAACAMALYSLCMFEEKDNRGYLIIFLALLAVLVSLSRTAFVFMCLFAFAVLIQSTKKVILAPKKKSSITTLLILAFMFLALASLLDANFLATSSVFERSIERIGQVDGVATDESASSRLLVYFRLLQSIPVLWFGTFSDQNYSRFFEFGDLALMTINPHSFVAEMSFLYGWVGLFCALGLVGIIFIGIMRNRDLPVMMRCIAAASLIFFQSVPSSILGDHNFFLPYLLLMYCRKNLLNPNSS